MLTNEPPWSEYKDQNVYGVMLKIRENFNNKIGPKIPTNCSKDCQIFLKKCLAINYLERSTVNQLLKEPFIMKTMDGNEKSEKESSSSSNLEKKNEMEIGNEKEKDDNDIESEEEVEEVNLDAEEEENIEKEIENFENESESDEDEEENGNGEEENGNEEEEINNPPNSSSPNINQNNPSTNYPLPTNPSSQNNNIQNNTTHIKQFHWKKGELIGRGSYGSVYLANNLDTLEIMAVKQIDLQKNQSQSFIKTVLNEINLMSGLKHENIVRYIGAEKSKSTLNIFLEFVPGGSLSDVIKKIKKLTEPQIRKITRQILFGLKYLHDKNIVHRDLKCGNILITTNSIIKLADFGHSKYLKNINDSLTNSGIHGTPLFMAPGF